MRIWDIHPGYLSRQSLLGEHAELHGLASILRAQRQPSALAGRGRRAKRAGGYANHPEVKRWRTFGWALGHRHKLLVAEMAQRGFRHQSPVTLRAAAGAWPRAFLDAPAEQFALLAAKYSAAATAGSIKAGRIPLPRSPQELWAQHKYSVLARNQAAYRELGRRVSAIGGQDGMAELASELVAWLRRPPPPGNARNAVEHMWGYLDTSAARPFADLKTRTALRAIGRLAEEQQATYLLAQTALTELAAWPVD